MTTAKVSSNAATATVGTGAGIISAYAAAMLSARFGLPVEVASGVVGVAAHLGNKLVHWVSKKAGSLK